MEHQAMNDDMRIEKEEQKKSVLAYFRDVVFLVTAVVLVFSLCFRVVVVSGPSMKNTLVDGDWLLLLGNTLYREPAKGDIVVVSKESYDDGTPIIKRVIALEGQTVDIDFESGIVYVDGVALDEPYTRTLTTTPEGFVFPATVPQGCVFVLGDNRDNSRDSRYPDIGMVDKREILGKAVFLFLPGNEKGSAVRDFSRIGGV